MNRKSKFLSSIGLAGLLCLVPASSVRAETEYSYTGQVLGSDPPNSFPYTSPDSVQGFFTVATALAANLPLTDITALVGNFSFTDGINTYTQDNFSSEDFQAATDGAGMITAWEVALNNAGGSILSCYNDPDAVCEGPGWGFPSEGDEAFADGGVGLHENFDPATNQTTAGTWTGPATVPEPSTFLLCGFGLMGTAIAARKRRNLTKA